MASLSPQEILKYDWRLELFIDKLTKKSAFELNDGKKVVLIPKLDQIAAIQSKDRARMSNIRFEGVDRKLYRFSDFLKNKEFNPRFTGTGVAAGIQYEEELVKRINAQLQTIRSQHNLAAVPIEYKGKTISVVRCAKTPGFVKSDIHFLDDNGKEVMWISYKNGRTAKDFQQYGGVSENEVKISNHAETQAFIKLIQKSFGKALPPKTAVRKKIADTTLWKLSVYGFDYGKQPGLNNVNFLLQGTVDIIPSGKNRWRFHADHISENGDRLTADYTPALWALYRTDRSQYGIQYCRMFIAPAGGRKPSIDLDER